jgi:hypothetical protein
MHYTNRILGSYGPRPGSNSHGVSVAILPSVSPCLAFKAVTYALIGLLAITLSALTLISLAKAHRTEDSIEGLFPFAFFVLVFCTLFALLVGYHQLHRTQSITLRFKEIASIVEKR